MPIDVNSPSTGREFLAPYAGRTKHWQTAGEIADPGWQLEILGTPPKHAPAVPT